MSLHSATEAWNRHRDRMVDKGVILENVRSYNPYAFDEKGAVIDRNSRRYSWDGALSMAMDALPLTQTAPNSAIPALLATFIDPEIVRIPFAPLKIAQILGDERKKGDWTDLVGVFPVLEMTGDVAAYGDYNNSGVAGANMNFPQRQSFHVQNIVRYGDHEVAMAAKANINLVTEKQAGAANAQAQFLNKSYAFGIKNLQNYGLLNDPNLTASLQPGPKAYNAQAHGPWITAGLPTATPNEVFIDIQALFIQLVVQTNGLIDLDHDSKLVLVCPPDVQVALTSANSFGVMTRALVAAAFPNIRFESAVQYNTANNGLSGNVVQLIAEEVDGQKVGFGAYTEKMRMHNLVPMLSAWEQKMSAGTWGTVLRLPALVASMLGV